MSAPGIPIRRLDAPLRTRERAALDLAVAALRQIADEATTMGPEHTAEAVLDHIRTLVPEIEQ